MPLQRNVRKRPGKVATPSARRGVKEYALFLKILTDASVTHDRMLDAFETAALQDDPAEKTKLCTFVVVRSRRTLWLRNSIDAAMGWVEIVEAKTVLVF